MTSLLALVAAGALALGGFAAPASAANGNGGGTTAEETTIANNLSFPAIWSDGVTLPAPYVTYPAGTLETFAAGTLTPTGKLDDTKWTDSTAVPDPADSTRTLYPQGAADPADPTLAANIWQAENALATPGTPVNVSQIDWGDNLEGTSVSGMLGKPIRVETTLLEDLTPPLTMKGYNMYHISGSKDTEVFGTDKTTYDSPQADVYSGCARLTIQRLEVSRTDPYVSSLTWDPTTGEWIGAGLIAPPIFNGGVWAGGEGTGYSAEINGSGKIVYGYNWQTSGLSAGDYRITFSLDPNCPAAALNTFITSDTTIVPVAEETEALAAAPTAGSGGSGSGGTAAVAQIDAANNLSYIDVELGSPAYKPYVPAPVNTALPVITGSAVEGQTLSATTGNWDNDPTGYTYQWQVCDSSGLLCSNIAGADTATYKLVTADVGHTMRVLVTATNAVGSKTASSDATAVVVPLAPANTALPVISGSAVEGQVLTATTGSWASSPTGYSYQWQVCDTSGCSNVAGATAESYKLVATDVGHAVRVLVTATNAGGSATAASAPTATVTGKPQQEQGARKLASQIMLQMQWLTQTRARIFGWVQPRHDGQRLMIQQRTRTGWKTVARVRLTKQTQQRSQFTLTLNNLAAGVYRAYFGGDKVYAETASNQMTIRALVRITTRLQVLAHQRIRLSGTVTPRHDGQRAMIQLRTRTGWRTVARVQLRKATAQRSQYAITLANAKRGTYRVYLNGDRAHRPSASANVTVR